MPWTAEDFSSSNNSGGWTAEDFSPKHIGVPFKQNTTPQYQSTPLPETPQPTFWDNVKNIPGGIVNFAKSVPSSLGAIGNELGDSLNNAKKAFSTFKPSDLLTTISPMDIYREGRVLSGVDETPEQKQADLQRLAKSPTATAIMGLGNGVTLGLNQRFMDATTNNQFSPIINQAKQNNPNEYNLGDVAGSIMPWTAAEGLLAKTGIKTIANPLLKRIALGVGAGAITGGGQSAIEGDKPIDIAKNTVLGGTMGLGGELVGAGIGKVTKGFRDIHGNLNAKVNNLLDGTTPKYESASNIDNIYKPYVNELPPNTTPIEMGALGQPTQLMLNAGPELPKIKPMATPTTLPGRFSLKNPSLEQAQQALHDATIEIQNHFGTADLRADEMARIKPELGIDLPKLFNDVESAKNARTIPTAEEARMGRVAGVYDNPSTKVNLAEPIAPKPQDTSFFVDKNIDRPFVDVRPKVEAPKIAPITEPLLPNINTLNDGGSGLNATQLPKNQYVHTDPIEINIGKNDKATSTDIRQAVVGKLNNQIVTGNQLRDTIKALAPNEQNAIQFYLDANGDKNYLQSVLSNPDTKLDPYRADIQQALNLSPEGQKAAEMAKQYYKESGQYSKDMGSTKNILDNYAARMWEQPPKGTIKSELNKPGLSTYTSHSQQRVYEHLADGILNDKTPATLNAGDLLSIHNQEMARANTNRALAQSLESNGLGKYQFEKPAQGFTAIDSLGKDIPTTHEGKPAIVHQSYVIPDGIAKGLQAITDPDYIKKIDMFRGLQKYQGLVKTVDLAYSLFHHITLTAQAIYNTHGGVDFIKNFDNLSKVGSKSFNEAEQWGAQHGLMTTKIDDNADIMRKLVQDEGVYGKITNFPVIKQGLQLAEANSNFLFGKVQRWLKVTDFQNKATAFVGKNPNMQNAEVTKGLRSIAEQVNNAYGGLNWKSLGVTPSVQSALRLGFLAPDWTASSILMGKQAFTKGPGGNAARTQYAIGLLGGAILTEGLNYLLTGHYTDKNPKGHELEVQVQPDVYISMFRSGIGDATKLGSNIVQDGVGGGTSRFLQGKLSPLIRTGITMATNRDYLGRQVVDPNKPMLTNEANFAKNVATSFAPIPFGVPNAMNYNKGTTSTGLQKYIGNALVDTGAGRYSKDSTQLGTPFDNPQKSYADNWLYDKFTAPKADKQQLDIRDKISAMEKASTEKSKAMSIDIGNQLQQGKTPTVPDISSKYGIKPAEAKTLITDAKDKLKSSSYTPMVKKYMDMSLVKRKEFYNTLSAEEKQIVDNATKGLK